MTPEDAGVIPEPEEAKKPSPIADGAQAITDVGNIVEGSAHLVSAGIEAVASVGEVASGAAEVASGAGEVVGAAAEGLSGCLSCSAVILIMLTLAASTVYAVWTR